MFKKILLGLFLLCNICIADEIVKMNPTGQILQYYNDVSSTTATFGALEVDYLTVNSTSSFGGVSTFNDDINMTSNDIITNGNVDGRDVSEDGTLLDNIVISTGSLQLDLDNLESGVATDTTTIQNNVTTLDGEVLKKDGSVGLTADWDAGNHDIGVLSIKATGSNGLYLVDDANNGIFIEDGGNVGIGTTSPTSYLQVNGTLSEQIRAYYSSTRYADFSHGGASCSYGDVNNNMNLSVTGGNPGFGNICFNTNGQNERLRIEKNGNIVIHGTATVTVGSAVLQYDNSNYEIDISTDVNVNGEVIASIIDASTGDFDTIYVSSIVGTSPVYFQNDINMGNNQIVNVSSITATSYTGIDANEIGIGTVNNAIYDDFQDYINFQSIGYIDNPTITDNGNGTLAVSSGTAIIKKTDDNLGEVVYITWDPLASVSCSNNMVNYIVVQYNGGNSGITAETDINNINFNNEFVVAYCYRRDNSICIIKAGNNLNKYKINNSIRLFQRGIERMSGGEVGETGTLNLTTTNGVFYLGQAKATTLAKNTATGDTFSYYYRDGGSDFTLQTGSTTITNIYYDNDSGTPVELTVNKYGVNWVYICLEGNINVLMGQGNYTLAQAQDAQIPSVIPDFLSKYAILASKIIVQKNASVFTSIQSNYTTNFPQATVNSHNDLSNIQGGTGNEYYHLTNSAYGNLSTQDQEILTTSDVTFSTITATTGVFSGAMQASSLTMVNPIGQNNTLMRLSGYGNPQTWHYDFKVSTGTGSLYIHPQTFGNSFPLEFTLNGGLNLLSTITSTNLNTGHGNNELYAMNQDVQTTDDVTFSSQTITNTSTVGTLTDGTLSITGGDITSVDTMGANEVTVSSISAISGDGLYLIDDGNNGMFVADGGNVGINTTSPSEKLDVLGNIKSEYGIIASTGIFSSTLRASGITSDDKITMYDGGSEYRVESLSAGNIRFISGKTAPPTVGLFMIVDDNIVDFSYYPKVSGTDLSDQYLSTADDVTFRSIITSTISATDSEGLWLVDDGNNGIFVEDGGNVGIGITSPSAILDITGTSASGKSLRLRSGDIAEESDANQIILSFDDTINYSHAIKTRHQSTSDLNNSIDFYVWDYDVDSSTDIGTKHVMSLNGGNVGIGTNDPNATLEVNGSVNYNQYTVISSTHITVEDYYIDVEYSDIGVSSITLSTADLQNGRTIFIKDADFNSSVNNIYVLTEAGATIDEESSVILSSDGESISVHSDGTNWFLQ